MWCKYLKNLIIPFALFFVFGTHLCVAVSSIDNDLAEIKIDDALTILKDCDSDTNGLVRKISNDLAIRKGKFGDYLFYKTPAMKKPQFLKLGDFNDDYKNCSLEFLKSWIKEKYDL